MPQNQVIYEISNLDFEQTVNRLTSPNSLVAFAYVTQKGLLCFGLKTGKTTTFLLSPDGKLQVKWSNLEEKKKLLPIVKSLLVPENGEKLTITPVYQQIFDIVYPSPSNLKIYWCDKMFNYVLMSNSPQARIIAKLLRLEYGNDEDENLEGLYGGPLFLNCEMSLAGWARWILEKRKAEKTL